MREISSRQNGVPEKPVLTLWVSLHVLIQTQSMLHEMTSYILSPKNVCTSQDNFPHNSTLPWTFLYGKPFGTWFCFGFLPCYVSVKKAAHFPWGIFTGKVKELVSSVMQSSFPGDMKTYPQSRCCVCAWQETKRRHWQRSWEQRLRVNLLEMWAQWRDVGERRDVLSVLSVSTGLWKFKSKSLNSLQTRISGGKGQVGDMCSS